MNVAAGRTLGCIRFASRGSSGSGLAGYAVDLSGSYPVIFAFGAVFLLLAI